MLYISQFSEHGAATMSEGDYQVLLYLCVETYTTDTVAI